jgi:hypothetical protein
MSGTTSGIALVNGGPVYWSVHAGYCGTLKRDFRFKRIKLIMLVNAKLFDEDSGARIAKRVFQSLVCICAHPCVSALTLAIDFDNFPAALSVRQTFAQIPRRASSSRLWPILKGWDARKRP